MFAGFTRRGFLYYTEDMDRTIRILKHEHVVAIIASQTLTEEGIAELVERFSEIYDDVLYNNSSYPNKKK